MDVKAKNSTVNSEFSDISAAIKQWRDGPRVGGNEDQPESDSLSGRAAMRVDKMLTFEPEHDNTTLLGQRFLCRGGAMLITGETGAGKSSLITQMAISFATGRDFFGIKPSRSLKSIIIQAENDFGDLSEEVQGVMSGLNIQSEDERYMVNYNVQFFEECAATGDLLADEISRLLKSMGDVDLIFIDPLLSFLGGDISKQQDCSRFLRNKLNPILKREQCAMVMVHHTGKPSNNPAAPRSDKYGGIGSSDIMNWARAILALNCIDEAAGVYELVASKRGKRSGLRGPFGKSVFIKHAETGIFWEVAEQPEKQPTSATEANVVYDEMRKQGPMKYADLARLIESAAQVSIATAKRRINDWKIHKTDDGLYVAPTVYKALHIGH